MDVQISIEKILQEMGKLHMHNAVLAEQLQAALTENKTLADSLKQLAQAPTNMTPALAVKAHAA